MRDGYNGWVNRETWRAQVELVDGLDPSDWWDVEAGSVEELTRRLAQTLAEITEENLLDACSIPSGIFVRTLVLDFLDRVDWDEIARHLVEDYADKLPAGLRADADATA